MMEKYLVEHCSPTLASIKTANLFRYICTSKEELQDSVQVWNEMLSGRGVFLEVLRKNEDSVLIYVYRKERLKEDLKRKGVFEFLRKCGYQEGTLEEMLDFLKCRLKECDHFPHEIGLFLGYPLEDVIGFVENEGKNSKCGGYWKVYGDQDQAVRLFEQFRKCKNIYKDLFMEGRSILQLTVAA